MAYGQQELAHDIRLACHGLDAEDNEFVIGLVGRELHPLSHLVQAMRKTRQTREFIAKMGPFFVGHVRTGSARERLRRSGRLPPEEATAKRHLDVSPRSERERNACRNVAPRNAPDGRRPIPRGA